MKKGRHQSVSSNYRSAKCNILFRKITIQWELFFSLISRVVLGFDPEIKGVNSHILIKWNTHIVHQSKSWKNHGVKS